MGERRGNEDEESEGDPEEPSDGEREEEPAEQAGSASGENGPRTPADDSDVTDDGEDEDAEDDDAGNEGDDEFGFAEDPRSEHEILEDQFGDDGTDENGAADVDADEGDDEHDDGADGGGDSEDDDGPTLETPEVRSFGEGGMDDPEEFVDGEADGDDPEQADDDEPGDDADDEPGDDADDEPGDGDGESGPEGEGGPPARAQRQYDEGKGPRGSKSESTSASGGSGRGTPKGGTATATVEDGLMGGGTAPDDEEMPLTEHVEEMALRFMAVGLVVVGIGGIALFYADDLINFLWYSFIGPGLTDCVDVSTMTVTSGCPRAVQPRIYHPLALVLARLKVATLVGLIAAMPVAVYQTYRFMRPGLYPRERRYYLAAVPTSLVLATVGVGFAYFAVLPAMFSYFTSYSEQAAEIAFGLTETFNLIVLMIGFFAITFQIPLLVMLAIMMGVTTRQWLADRRLYFWGGFAAVAFLFSPDPTGMAPLMVAVTMIVLFDGTLLLLKWTSSESLVPTAEGLSARRPYAWVAAALVGYLLSTGPVPQGYYGDLPPAVTDWLVAQDLVTMTPILIGGSLIVLFETGALLLRFYGHSERALRARLAVHRIRIPVWLVAVVVGYFGSPDPLLLRAADQFAIPTVEALAITGGLLVAYELAIGVLRIRGREE